MRVRADFGALRKTKWYEFAVRVLFGGLVTVGTGLVARKWGPALGGLFLAFPAIFPASATLVEKHTSEEKRRQGLNGQLRGREAAALDARGAAMGCFGLAAFGVVMWRLLPGHNAAAILGAATLAWFLIGLCLWRLRRWAVSRAAAGKRRESAPDRG